MTLKIGVCCLAFKIFDAYGAASRPETTLRASGYLFISKGIMKRARSENATHAQLMFDEVEGKLGIRLYEEFDNPADGTTREASVEKSGVAVNLLPLLRYYGIPEPKVTGKQVLPVTFDDQVIVIDLKMLREAKGKPARVPSPPPSPPPRVAPPSPPRIAPKQPQEEFDDDIPF